MAPVNASRGHPCKGWSFKGCRYWHPFFMPVLDGDALVQTLMYRDGQRDL